MVEFETAENSYKWAVIYNRQNVKSEIHRAQQQGRSYCYPEFGILPEIQEELKAAGYQLKNFPGRELQVSWAKA